LKNHLKPALVLSALLIAAPLVSQITAGAALARDKHADNNKACPAQAEKLEPVHAEIKIEAPPHLVWNVVHEERKHDPDMAYSKVLSEKDNEVLLEQKFTVLPVIGTSVCTMQQKETPDSRIDYKLIKSDRFKVMEGSWVLVPSADNKSTTLQLTTTLDLGMPVPRGIFNAITAKKLDRRLQHIKTMAEEEAKAAKVAEARKGFN
jgi:hypothetical protein